MLSSQRPEAIHSFLRDSVLVKVDVVDLGEALMPVGLARATYMSRGWQSVSVVLTH